MDESELEVAVGMDVEDEGNMSIMSLVIGNNLLFEGWNNWKRKAGQIESLILISLDTQKERGVGEMERARLILWNF